MFATDVAMVDLDPDGFAWLCALVSARDRAGLPELVVLHRGGRAERVLHPTSGELPPSTITDPVPQDADGRAALAAALLDREGIDRVTLLDAELLPSLSADLVDAGRRAATQPELLWACAELRRKHAAITTAPPPPPDPWPAIAARLGALPDGTWAVVDVVADDVGPALRVGAELRRGLAVTITSRIPPGAAVAARLSLPAAALADVIAAPDVLAGLRRALGEPGVEHFGIEEVLWPS